MVSVAGINIGGGTTPQRREDRVNVAGNLAGALVDPGSARTITQIAWEQSRGVQRGVSRGSDHDATPAPTATAAAEGTPVAVVIPVERPGYVA